MNKMWFWKNHFFQPFYPKHISETIDQIQDPDLCPRVRWYKNCPKKSYLRSKRPPSRCVRIVVDYANTVSEWSTTTPKPCLHSQRLCRHPVCVVIDYFSMCPCSQWQRHHGVRVVNDYADNQFLKISNYIFGYFFP